VRGRLVVAGRALLRVHIQQGRRLLVLATLVLTLAATVRG
jgi:hypothetical protein